MGRPVLRALIWGVAAAVSWVVGAFVVSGAWGYFHGWKADAFWGGTRPPGWNAAEELATFTTVFLAVPLSPVAFVVAAVASWRRHPGAKPPPVEV